MMNRFAILAAIILLAGSGAPAFAQDPITFGQFLQQDSGQRLFRYKNEDSATGKGAEIYSTSSTASNDPGAIPVFFLLSADDLPADLSSPQDAGLSVDFLSNSGTTATSTPNGRIQMFGSGSITILRTTPAAEGLNAHTNLLTVTFTNAELDASQSSGSFTFRSNDDSAITYTSDFLDFSNIVSENFSFSFSGASPQFSATLGSSASNTRFSGSGSFAATPQVPEISTWVMLFAGFGVVGLVMRAGRRQRDLYAA